MTEVHLEDPERPRRIVKIAARKARFPSIKDWFFKDEKGIWEKAAIDLLDQSKDRAKELGLGVEEVDDQAAIVLYLRALEATKQFELRQR